MFSSISARLSLPVYWLFIMSNDFIPQSNKQVVTLVLWREEINWKRRWFPMHGHAGPLAFFLVESGRRFVDALLHRRPILLISTHVLTEGSLWPLLLLLLLRVVEWLLLRVVERLLLLLLLWIVVILLRIEIIRRWILRLSRWIVTWCGVVVRWTRWTLLVLWWLLKSSVGLLLLLLRIVLHGRTLARRTNEWMNDQTDEVPHLLYFNWNDCLRSKVLEILFIHSRHHSKVWNRKKKDFLPIWSRQGCEEDNCCSDVRTSNARKTPRDLNECPPLPCQSPRRAIDQSEWRTFSVSVTQTKETRRRTSGKNTALKLLDAPVSLGSSSRQN